MTWLYLSLADRQGGWRGADSFKSLLYCTQRSVVGNPGRPEPWTLHLNRSLLNPSLTSSHALLLRSTLTSTLFLIQHVCGLAYISVQMYSHGHLITAQRNKNTIKKTKKQSCGSKKQSCPPPPPTHWKRYMNLIKWIVNINGSFLFCPTNLPKLFIYFLNLLVLLLTCCAYRSKTKIQIAWTTLFIFRFLQRLS